MCGIAGLLTLGDSLPKDLDPDDVVTKMISRIGHRGPESTEVKRYNQDRCVLSHARLRISDGRDIADQPFASANGKWKLVFNGEIYNYRELENSLRGVGWVPRTNSDTERLVELINKEETGCLHQIDGMFAFAAYNKDSGSLFLARDRYGQKPLYYIKTDKLFGFASELSALLELSAWIEMSVSVRAMSEYFSFRHVPAPNTAINPIRKLEPGQSIIVRKSGEMYKNRYFEATKDGTICTNDQRSLEIKEDLLADSEKHIESLLRESVNCTVPDNAGVIISGGIDSTLIATLVREKDQQEKSEVKRNSYTVQIEDQPSDDTKWAKHLSEQWGWTHREVRLQDRHLINAYERKSVDLNEPVGDRSLLPTWCLAQTIQLDEKVAIGGDGADEIFLGYERYFKSAEYLNERPNENWAKLYWQKVLPIADAEALQNANQLQLEDPLSWHHDVSKILQIEHHKDAVSFLQLLDIAYYLPGVLAKVDQSSMYWGLEIRTPYLNTRLSLAGMALSQSQLYEEKRTKSVLRKILEEKTKSQQNKRKYGFGATVRRGSEFERYLTEKAIHNLRELKRHRGTSNVTKWLLALNQYTSNWTQNSLFALCIWLDWMEATLREFPSINLE